MNKTLQNKLDSFLSEKIHSDGGWAPVSSKDLNSLNQIVYLIISAKWKTDADGSLPIDYELIDRTMYEPYTMLPIPYVYKATHEELPRIVSTLSLNAKICADRLHTVIQIWERRIQENNKNEQLAKSKSS